jgi:histidinol-phosphate/aromatic aminotransferase/cobyric acid decarboxylase-like protein
MLDLTKNFCQDKFLKFALIDLYNNIQVWKTPDKQFVYEKLSDFLKIPRENIEIGFGTIDIVDRFLSLFANTNKTITSIGPYWSGIKWACEKNNLNFDNTNGDIAYIARPNSRDGQIRDINFSDYEYVIIDEAYGDFCSVSNLKNCIDMKHVIVTKTFSKSISSPGLRFAYCSSNEKIISDIRKLSHHYSLNIVAQHLIPKVFDLINPHVERMLETKKFIQSQYRCLPSDANFVRVLEQPSYNVKLSKIDDYYRFTLIDLSSLQYIYNDL